MHLFFNISCRRFKKQNKQHKNKTKHEKKNNKQTNNITKQNNRYNIHKLDGKHINSLMAHTFVSGTEKETIDFLVLQVLQVN